MKVSIIIPCFNVQDYIIDAVHSAYKQAYEDVEVICVDNNSSDNTYDILKELKIEFPSLILLEENRKGAPYARNKGLENSKGEWIQFLDADDLLLEGKIKGQINVLHKSSISSPSFILGNAIKQDLKGIETFCEYNIEEPYISLIDNKLGITSSNLFHRDSIKEIGGWDVSFKSSQEAKLMFELLKRNEQLIHDQSFNTIIRERPEGQISQRNPQKKWQQFVLFRMDVLNYLREYKKQYYDLNKELIQHSIFNHLRVYAKYDLKDANRIFKHYLKGNFSIKKSKSKIGIYDILFSLFGFYKTEKIIKFIKAN